jgi:cation transport ATPase
MSYCVSKQLVMSFSSVSVISNSLRLKRVEL